MQAVLIWTSNILIFSSYLAYEWAMVKGKAKPHRTTRLVIAIIVILGFLSMYAQGDRVVVWFLGICSVQSLVMLAMSIKWGMGGWAKGDIVALIIALIGIIFWKITSNPALGLYAAVTADFAGMIPALTKTYKFPKTEHWLPFAFDLSAILLTALAIRNGGFNDYLYPAYLFIINSLMMVFLLRREPIVDKKQ